jgi:hypothetical protein
MTYLKQLLQTMSLLLGHSSPFSHIGKLQVLYLNIKVNVPLIDIGNDHKKKANTLRSPRNVECLNTKLKLMTKFIKINFKVIFALIPPNYLSLLITK